MLILINLLIVRLIYSSRKLFHFLYKIYCKDLHFVGQHIHFHPVFVEFIQTVFVSIAYRYIYKTICWLSFSLQYHLNRQLKNQRKKFNWSIFVAKTKINTEIFKYVPICWRLKQTQSIHYFNPKPVFEVSFIKKTNTWL